MINLKGYLIFIGIIIGIFVLSSLGRDKDGGSNYTGVYDDLPYEESQENRVTSDNWECTSDCSGHEAGYEWASDNGITDPDECGGNSDSFIEGCQAYANESQMEYEEEYENEYNYSNY